MNAKGDDAYRAFCIAEDTIKFALSRSCIMVV